MAGWHRGGESVAGFGVAGLAFEPGQVKAQPEPEVRAEHPRAGPAGSGLPAPSAATHLKL